MILKKIDGYPNHEYLRDTLAFEYMECRSCKKRSQLTCIKCRFCWSCHWKREREEIEKNPQVMLIVI
jgi:hypothetical protein